MMAKYWTVHKGATTSKGDTTMEELAMILGWGVSKERLENLPPKGREELLENLTHFELQCRFTCVLGPDLHPDPECQAAKAAWERWISPGTDSTTRASSYQDGYAGPFTSARAAEQALIALAAAGSAVSRCEIKQHEEEEA